MSATAPALGAGNRQDRTPSPALLWAIGLAGVAAAALAFYLALTSDHVEHPGLQAALMDWMLLPFVLSGLVAWWRRPAIHFGPLMIVAGFTIALSTLSWANTEPWSTIGELFDLAPAVLFLHVVLAFPSGRLGRRPEQILVGAGYFMALGVQIVWLMLEQQPGAADAVHKVQLASLAALCLAGIVLLFVRRRGASRPLRRRVRLLVDSFALGLLMVAVLFIVGGFFYGPAFETIRRITFAVIGLAPVGFLIGLLNARLSRVAAAELLVTLKAEPTPGGLRAALARALGDPSVSLAFWLPDFGDWADMDGHRVELPDADSGRTTTPIQRTDGHVALLIHDSSLNDEPELLEAVSAGAGLALDNARLQAELKARLEELRGSRGRVIEAGRQERQRLERNLHDGAQQRLIALSLELGRLGQRLNGDLESRRRLEHAQREVARSIDELRAVARGLHPAVVSGHGLAVALESLVATAPLPVRLEVGLDDRLDERLEVAAYYVVAESLANIGKHAQANSARVEVARDNGSLVVEVVDDGVGGADPECGSGLRGLADRVEGLDGRLRVWTPSGWGTRVRAEIPCA